MTATIAEDRFAGIESRLDFIVEELGHMKRVRTGTEDLMADFTLVARDALGEAATAFDTMNLRPREIVQLLRTALVDAKLLTAALLQMESAVDLFKDVQIVAHDLYRQATTECQALNQKGYFEAAAAGMRIGDALVQSHSPSDLKQVEASVPQLVGFLRELTRPEVLQALEAIIHGFGRVQATMNVNKSVFEIMRDMNSPEARRGISILVEFLKVVGSRSTSAGPAGAQAAETSER
jgi:uncharacterized protein YjgD (DUF1641 family)